MSRLKMVAEIKKKNRVITIQRAKVNEVIFKNNESTFVVKNLKGQITVIILSIFLSFSKHQSYPLIGIFNRVMKITQNSHSS